MKSQVDLSALFEGGHTARVSANILNTITQLRKVKQLQLPRPRHKTPWAQVPTLVPSVHLSSSTGQLPPISYARDVAQAI